MLNDIEKKIYKLWETQSYTDIIPLLNNLKCNYALIKGKALSFQMKNPSKERFSSDIDILIDKKNLNKLEALLINNGYVSPHHSRAEHLLMMTHSHQAFPWIKPLNNIKNIIIDINFDILWGEFEGIRINIDEFLDDCMLADFYGNQAYVLTPTKALLQLILHHYKDINSIFLLSTKNSITYSMFEDIYFLLKNNQESITIDKLYALSSLYGITEYVFYMLYYTAKIFSDEVLQKFVKAFESQEGILLLDYYGLCSSERKKWNVDFNTRLACPNKYELIKKDLTEMDIRKIKLNKQIFLGV